MDFYIWFLFTMISALFLFLMLRLFIRARKMSILFKIIYILLMIILLLGLYFLSTRYLGLFRVA